MKNPRSFSWRRTSNRNGNRWAAAAMIAGAAAAATTLVATAAQARTPPAGGIKVDHFGYRPADAKVAVVSADPGAAVEIRTHVPPEGGNRTEGTVVFRIPVDGGSIAAQGVDGPSSGETLWWIDFTPFASPGTYRLVSPLLGDRSEDFEIRGDVYDGVMRKALETFYLQRCNTAKAAAHAGAWADEQVCHPSDATAGPADGQTSSGVFDLRGGWHDAGDYNKYVWGDLALAVLPLLRAFEDHPSVFPDGGLGIPEAGNGTSDLLDEIRWELDWMLSMQLPTGAVLRRLKAPTYESSSPPSADVSVRGYFDPDLESGAVFTGVLAAASRVYAGAGLSSFAATLRDAALLSWSWLATQGDSDLKAWAAAEVFRLDPAVSAAKDYVDGYDAAAWKGRFLHATAFDTQAALTYVEAPGATAAVAANMRGSLADQVDFIFSQDDLYRNGMPDWAYHWGSNQVRAGYGLFLSWAAELGTTGARDAAELIRHAQSFLHYFHGQNPLNMVYLTNMTGLGGEHASYQLYHAWFGDSRSPFSTTNYLGKPETVGEPAYPYFAGVDNHGVSDDDVSLLGPAPGFVPGGPNKDYSGDSTPPADAVFYNLFYRDWADNGDQGNPRPWEITENSIKYQGLYAALVSYFAAGGQIFADGFESGDTSGW